MYNKLVSHKFFSTNIANTNLLNKCRASISEMHNMGTYKIEREITSPQDAEIKVNNKRTLNFCSNNYLGLSSDPELIDIAKNTLDSHGYGMSSVRFICGTQDIHKKLEKTISDFHSTEDTILYSSCFDANTGFFETILDENDAVISDSLNHASIIDGIRLCKAKRMRYDHINMNDLEEKLKEADGNGSKLKFIVTDGVFSMDGDIAPLDKIVDLAKKYNANIFLDECHSTGVVGKTGRGTPEYFGVTGEIDITTSTLGKAIGGASGGFTTGRKEVIELLRQKSRPYLFSNSIVPSIGAASIKVFENLIASNERTKKLHHNIGLFRKEMSKLGFTLLGKEGCAIVPVYVGNEKIATEFGNEMCNNGIYVVGFCYPVVPKGKARVRVQLSAAHSEDNIMEAVRLFERIGKEKKII